MRAVTLLSGGLDSTVSMLMASREAEILLAITIDYGQSACMNEIRSSKNLCELYKIPHKIIELPFMKDMQSGIIAGSEKSIKDLWVPNRNGLFINLAACYAENLRADWVICGLNNEEAHDFPDNSPEFVQSLDNSLYYSTLNHVKVKSFVQSMDKVQIVEKAKEIGINFKMLWSCYRNGERPCGVCPSCIRNKEAFEKMGVEYDENFIY